MKLSTRWSWLNPDGLLLNAFLSNTSFSSSKASCFLYLFNSTSLFLWLPCRFSRNARARQDSPSTLLHVRTWHQTLCPWDTCWLTQKGERHKTWDFFIFMLHTQHTPEEHRRETYLSVGARNCYSDLDAIHGQPLCVARPPCAAFRSDLKKTAVAATLEACEAREASPHLPPLPIRNEGLVVAALLSVVESTGQGHLVLMCGRTTILFFF